MQKAILVSLFLFFGLTLLMSQEIIRLSNPSFEIKKTADRTIPQGWNWSEIHSESPATVQWADQSKEPSEGISYITLNASKGNNQSISQPLGSQTLKAFHTYEIELDARRVSKSTTAKFRILGYGNSEKEIILSTSKNIKNKNWKKIRMEITPTEDIHLIVLKCYTDKIRGEVAVDNISKFIRIEGEYDCKKILKNDFARVERDTYMQLVNDKNYLIHIAKFHCVYSSFYIQKSLFDTYGKWDDVQYYDNGNQDKLIWKNVQIFDDSTENYTLAASGSENEFDSYASIVVFDSEGKDMINPDHPMSAKIIEWVGNLIKRNDEKKAKFYDIYWSEIRNK